MKLGSIIAIGVVLSLCVESADAGKTGKDAKNANAKSGKTGGVRFCDMK